MILLIGNRGSVGRRYSAILDYLGADWVGYDSAWDANPPVLPRFDKFIVATPTPTHYGVVSELPRDRPVLCEKPLASSFQDAKEMADSREGYIVSNYRYALGDGPHLIEYDFFNTGKDGLRMDCCQLLMLDRNAVLRNKSPYWTLKDNGETVPYETIERSYVYMLRDFVDGNYERLWSFKDGVEMIWRATQ